MERRREGLSSPTERRIPPGIAPIAAISERVTATLIHPFSQSVIPSGKSVLSWTISVDATIYPSPMGIMAQSSETKSFPTTSMTIFLRVLSSNFLHLPATLGPVFPVYLLKHPSFLFLFE
ncbi:MAG: hypothetical protein A4E38_01523 [Methanoregulaceae archaeon PtaB.Bin108]|nr:MAG: hypothetical protein A4E38_01523 [Methanoregulaceae archaeon PtaB.Bin108]